MAWRREPVDWPKAILQQLLDGEVPDATLQEIQSRPKEENRFEKILEIEQGRVPWHERIVVPLQEHLYVVLRRGDLIVKCACGHEFGDYRRNWKLGASVYERDCRDGEIYQGPRAADPDWMILREFYCPGCDSLLDTEAVPPGYPFTFAALPDIAGFYSEHAALRERVFGDVPVPSRREAGG
ncbi:MAG: acetone carboxylase subunit gamma [Candidatus Rokubacteria bacterium]|nr:acetone carboxylase subunit gamma [Candidatus Rokubacteria bacterium]